MTESGKKEGGTLSLHSTLSFILVSTLKVIVAVIDMAQEFLECLTVSAMMAHG